MNYCRKCGELLVLVADTKSPMDYNEYECPSCDRKNTVIIKKVNIVTPKKPKRKISETRQDILNKKEFLEKLVISKAKVENKNTYRLVLQKVSGGTKHLMQWRLLGKELDDIVHQLNKDKRLQLSTKRKCKY